MKLIACLVGILAVLQLVKGEPDRQVAVTNSNPGNIQRCQTVAPCIVSSHSNNQFKGDTWVFSYTNDASALADPVKWLRGFLEFDKIRNMNQEYFCNKYTEAKKLYDGGQKQAATELLRTFYLSSMDESKMAGFGTYFAQDPLPSRSYGR
jgi:hypothetical protein